MDRLFLDSNVLFSAAYLPSSNLRKLWELNDVELITSGHAASEAYRNLTVKQPDRFGDLANLMKALRLVPDVTAASSGRIASLLPPKDRPILQAAIAAQATHLLTGDRRHFGSLYGQRYDRVRIVPPGEYIRGRPA
ncbi:MAG: PIN domain-containing protein [Pirellulales bacterium]